MFCRGDQVEVIGKEEGFEGSLFSAIVITGLWKDEYIVQYTTLLKDDDSGTPLREIVASQCIRPAPPALPVDRFRPNDAVDAYHCDGWWLGKISRKNPSGSYSVVFETTEEMIVFPPDKLRIHQQWKDGKWMLPKGLKN